MNVTTQPSKVYESEISERHVKKTVKASSKRVPAGNQSVAAMLRKQLGLSVSLGLLFYRSINGDNYIPPLLPSIRGCTMVA